MGAVYAITCRNCGILRSNIWCGPTMHMEEDSDVTEIMVCPNCERISVITKKWADWSRVRCEKCGETMVDAENRMRPLKCPLCGEHSVFLETGLLFD